MTVRREIVIQGAKDAFGAPAAVLFAGMVGFGAMGQANGLSIWATSAISFLMYALPGQVVLIEMVVLGASALTIAIAVALTATRFFTMCLTFFPQFEPRSRDWKYYFYVHLMAMTSWAIGMREFPKIERSDRLSYFIGFGLVCWGVSTPGTALGYLLAGQVPSYLNLGLVFINPLFFLLTFVDVKPLANRLAILLGAVGGPLIYLWTPNYTLLISGLVLGTIAYGVDRWMRSHRV